MKVQAVRGVCIGPERHLAVGDVAELEPQLAQFLINIGAVMPVADAPVEPEVQSQAPAKPGKKGNHHVE